MISKHIIKTQKVLNKSVNSCVKKFIKQNNNPSLNNISAFLRNEFDIDITLDQDIVLGYSRDWSNLPGNADALARPNSETECAILLHIFNYYKLPVTISAGKTNLTGSATPKGGLIISTVNMTNPCTVIDSMEKTADVAIGAVLEDVRNEILKQTNNKLYYPVDPTSRKEALIGGTIACNASGFIPGDKGATRYWVNGLDILLPDGEKIHAIRNQYISKKSTFIIGTEAKQRTINIPTYNRPKIKNASGPFTADKNEIDFIDLIVGSEGCFGMITKAQLKLSSHPDNYLDLFIPFNSESDAIQFYHYICDSDNIENFTAFEYFGYNCQNYMTHKDYFFKTSTTVGIYLQYPLYNTTLDENIEFWIDLINKSNLQINLDDVIMLNEPRNWKLFFEARHSMPTKALEKTKELDAISMITDTIVPPDNFNIFLEYTHELLRDSNIEYLLFGHLGDCHLHFHLIYEKNKQMLVDNIYRKIIKKSSKLNGVYSAEHGTGKRKRIDFIECYGKEAVNQVKKCKADFDPNLILNRGNIVSYD